MSTTGQVTERPARERILEAACDLIAADGIDAVRIARVAQRAGASTGLVHHYFSTREELLEQALIHSFALVGLERFPDGVGEAESATAALARAIRECLPEPGRSHRDWVLWVELWLRTVRHPELRPTAARLYGRVRDWLAEGITDCGVPPDRDAGELADRTLALCDGLGVRVLIEEIPIEYARRQVWAYLAGELALDASLTRS
jgi:AcrR family transcriptional regulator